MTTVYLALGSNVGDSKKNIVEATKLLAQSINNIKQAPLYQTKPMGYTEQADFVNTALKGKTTLSPRRLLAFVKEVEQEVGRVERFRWGPREIDIDIIFYGDEIINEDDFTIPHPRLAERDFVLKPLCDLEPHKQDPVSGKAVQQLLDELPLADRSIA